MMKRDNHDDISSKLYRALCQNENDEEVMTLCIETTQGEGAFYKYGIYNQSVISTAIYIKRCSLAHMMIDALPETHVIKLKEDVSDWGDTLLHNAVTFSKGIGLVKKLLKKAPELLPVRNKAGETAVFQACRYGKLDTFKYLANKVDHYCQLHQISIMRFFQRDDNTTILHMAILTGNFYTALTIAERYRELHFSVAKSGMTPLQILACSPKEFKSGTQFRFFGEKLVYSCIDKPRCILPMLETLKEVKQGHRRAEKLAKILVNSDDSWKNGPKPNSEFTPEITASNSSISLRGEAENVVETRTHISSSNSTPNAQEIPLILAAKHGCVEIVKEILNQHAQAVVYVNHEQQTFLHVAIKYRKFEVFKLADPRRSPIMGSSSPTAISRMFRYHFRVLDIHGNSILHMVGISGDTQEDVKMKSPVLRLSMDLQLLEYLKKQSPKCLINHRNDQMLTADELFAKKNDKLRIEATDWLKRTSENCTVVIVLIATVAFAAAYTIPGGPNSQTGYPVLLSKPFFLVFTIADVLSLGFALTAVVIFLAILTSSFQLKEFKRSLPEKLLLGFTLLFLSVSMMMVAFAATIILMISNKERWTKIGVYAVAFFPVCVFILSYIPLYIKLVESLRYWVLKIGKSLPRIRCAPGNSSPHTLIPPETCEV